MILWASHCDSSLDLTRDGRLLLGGIRPILHFNRGGDLAPISVTVTDGTAEYVFRETGVSLTLRAEEANGAVYLSVHTQLTHNAFKLRTFAARNGLELRLGAVAPFTRAVSFAPFSSYWTKAHWTTTLTNLPEQTLGLVTDCGADAMYYLPLPTAQAKSEFFGTPDGCSLGLSMDCAGYAAYDGCILAIASADTPYHAADLVFRAARKSGKITVPLREEREFPELFRYFGWCTWNAFYHDVTDAGMTEKLEEFRAKGMPIKWVLVDDGWSQTNDANELCSFEENKDKFPAGLRGFIDKAKQVYGISWVGVWHSFMGYWCGIAPDSPLAKAEKDHIQQLHNGMLLPSSEEEKAFAFFDAWHRWQEAQGVDFVKIDTQGCLKDFLRDETSVVEAAAATHRAMDRSTAAHFGNRVINCMGVTQENLFGRPQTGLSRNSDDFFPDRFDSFPSHLMQNAYNGLFHHQLYFCDWDMWWSQHESATRSAVLRAVSGGPVYVSDKVGCTDAAEILPLVEADGRVLMCDDTALPTRDCLFCSPQELGAVKLFNHAGENGVIAVFNTSADHKPVEAEVRLTDIEDLNADAEYICYAYFAKKFVRVTRDTVLHCELAYGEAETYCFYPIRNGCIELGDTAKYVSAASSAKRHTAVEALPIA